MQTLWEFETAVMGEWRRVYDGTDEERENSFGECPLNIYIGMSGDAVRVTYFF
ncbi:hypothetical protein [Porphyromonas canoris]|uniref:hypothetical protein n=1 Tax=Porphyromonas canoris TaxID=36875 RepID=UPI000AC6FACE|nr:hypothetical protein [Porphyromonas canoris]